MPQSAPILKDLVLRSVLLLIVGVLIPSEGHSRIDRLRASWRSNPSTSMVIGWDQVTGGRPVFFYDKVDHGQSTGSYRFQTPPSWANRDKSMNNVFVRLENLEPNTVYYFVVQDSEGVSKRYSFQTAPGDASERLSVIAGSDSRNHRMARCDANRLVSKLRPHCVIFGGDMTDDDSDQEWREWFDDWQLTIGSDGRVFPIIPARGNHEAKNATLVNCFDVPSPDVYYALTLGGNLFRIYTLNTQIPGGGEQRDWLGRDLQANQNVIWRMAQYHQAIRPHNAAKQEREELIVQWATLFHKYKVQLVMESDAHVAKTTWPIRPSKQPGSHEGFIRDDVAGTIYIGEGGWGAPLRANDDPKPWTRSHGRFNQFKWIFIDRDKIEIRTIKTEGSTRVAEVSPNNIFEPPYGLVIWNPKEGDVVRILNPNARPRPPHGAPPNGGPVVQNADGASSLSPDASGSVHIDYMLTEISQVQIILINSQMQEMARLEYKAQRPGPYKKSLDLSKAPPGRYDLIVKANDKLNQRFVIHIR